MSNPKIVSFDRSAAYLHHRAMMNRRENRVVDALELMRRAVEAQPDNSEYRLDLAELLCEMGCHEQSARLLLDMLSEKDAPSECFYGLALNQLGMNDLGGARQSLDIYRSKAPQGEHYDDVSRLAEELDFFVSMNRPSDRRLYRAMRVAARACDAMRAGNLAKACRLFAMSLERASEQYEMRALYAMALAMAGQGDAARRQVERAAEAFPPSPRALCVCAQAYNLLGDREKAVALMDRAGREHLDGQDLRLMLYAAGELDLHDRAAEYARLALQETPYDRELLHIRAVALKRTGEPDAEAAKCWDRILRIDPEDSVAQYYSDAAHNGILEDAPDYGYQVPEAEVKRRLGLLTEALGQGFEAVRQRWMEDGAFRQIVRWAAGAEDPRLGRASMTMLATLEEDDARSVLRELMFAPEVSRELKLHAAVLLKLQGRALSEVLPRPMDVTGEVLVDADALLEKMSVGDRQLVRYADEVLREEYKLSARPLLALMWTTYRRLRGTHGDAIKRVDAAAAGLAYNLLTMGGQRPGIAKLARDFGCPARQLVFCARRIAGCLDEENPTREP